MCGGFSASCETLRQQFDKKGRYISGKKTPKKGYIIFFKGTRHSGANHIGIVTKVANGKIHTMEGNTNGGSTVVDNGGSVAHKTYSIGYDKILGYGTPKYDAEKKAEIATTATLSAPKPTLKKGVSGAAVKTLQKCLNKAIKAGLTVDGIFGDATYKAVVKFQKAHKISADGIYGTNTYKKLKAVIK